MNQLIHQESVTANLQRITSNSVPLLPKPVLWFQISWGCLISIPLIMVMLRFTLHILKLNITLNLFQIQTRIISDQKLLPPSLRINMNQFNSLHGDEPTDPPRECNSHPPAYHFKYNTSLLKTSPVVSAITGRLNHYTIDNGDFEVHH